MTKYSEVAESHNSNPGLKLSWLFGGSFSEMVVQKASADLNARKANKKFFSCDFVHHNLTSSY